MDPCPLCVRACVCLCVCVCVCVCVCACACAQARVYPHSSSSLSAPKPVSRLPALQRGGFKTRSNQVRARWVSVGRVVIVTPNILLLEWRGRLQCTKFKLVYEAPYKSRGADMIVYRYTNKNMFTLKFSLSFLPHFTAPLHPHPTAPCSPLSSFHCLPSTNPSSPCLFVLPTMHLTVATAFSAISNLSFCLTANPTNHCRPSALFDPLIVPNERRR